MNTEERNYQEFFKEELYGGFVKYLLGEYGANKVNVILKDDALVTKKGVHRSFLRDFNRFLSLNPSIHKRFAKNHARFMNLRNIAGGQLAFPIDVEDEGLMIREKLRIPEYILPDFKDVSRSKNMKRSAGPMRGQIIRSNDFTDTKYLVPKRLTVHFKSGYAQYIDKTTMTFKVASRGEAMYILLDRYENKVAYALIQNEEEFCFVNRKDGSKRKNRKLRSKI